MSLLRFCAPVGFLVLAACASTTSDTTPPPANFRATIVANRSSLFKDPDSIKDASIATPFRYLGLGWKVCVRLNGKNGFGGYSGLTTYTILVYDNGAPPLMAAPTIYEGCGSAQYSPFPEIEGRNRS